MRQFGQAKLPPSFITRSSSVSHDSQPKPSKKPISLSEFLNRKLGKTSCRSLQEKQSSIGSLGSDKKDLGGKRNEEDETSLIPIFQQFNSGLKWREKEQPHSRKRKNPSEFSSGDTSKHQKCLVVLGDDPKPRPRRRGREPMEKRAKTIYNHYASGHGWWEGDKEGIDSDEVGNNEVWEGLGSTTLGGLEWH